MYGRSPAAGDADAIAWQGASGPGFARVVERADDQSPYTLASPGSEDSVAGQHLAAGRSQCCRLHRTFVLSTHIDDGDLDPSRLEICGGRIGGRARGYDHR